MESGDKNDVVCLFMHRKDKSSIASEKTNTFTNSGLVQVFWYSMRTCVHILHNLDRESNGISLDIFARCFRVEELIVKIS